MDAGVGAAGADDARIRSQQPASGRQEQALNGHRIGLDLPPGVGGAVVSEAEPESAVGRDAGVYRRRRSTRFSQRTTTSRNKPTLTIWLADTRGSATTRPLASSQFDRAVSLGS